MYLIYFECSITMKKSSGIVQSMLNKVYQDKRKQKITKWNLPPNWRIYLDAEVVPPINLKLTYNFEVCQDTRYPSR